MKLAMHTTVFENGAEKTVYEEAVFKKDKDCVENEVLNLYPDITYETFEGFGGAVTDASGYVYSLMNEAQKKEVIDTYFKADKMNYRLVRVHMDSCDFAVNMYEAMSDETDRQMNSFSFERTEKYIMPMLKDAAEAAGEPLTLMLSPWSPPVFMKTNNDRCHGGRLKEEYRQWWADYICRYIEEFEKRGFKVDRISLQNEPNAVQTWDSCQYTAEEEKIFLRDFMYPSLQKHGLSHVKIYIWDHNKERIFERACGVIDETTDKMVAGIAFHWYSGDHFEALSLVREKFPDKQLLLSESCLEYSKFDQESADAQAVRLAHEMIGDLNHGMTAFHDWNILLDETGGPNHVGNFCHAPFLYNRGTKELMRQNTQSYFNHFTHYIRPGAARIAYSKYTQLLEAAAYKNKDGKIVAVLLNRSEKAMPVNFRLNGQTAFVKLAAGAVATVEIM